MESIKQYLRGGLFVLTNYFLIREILRRKYTVKKLQKVKTQQIVSPKYAMQCAKQNNTKQQFLIKLVPSQFKQLKIKKDIYSNQVDFIEPSTIEIAEKVIKLIKKAQNSNLKAQRKLESINYCNQWKGKGQQGDFYDIKGLGIIIDNSIFEVKWRYELQEVGILKSIWKFVCYVLECVLSFKNQQIFRKKMLSLNKERKPHILGPIVGSIYYKLRLFTNKSILLQATVQDGKIIPKMTGGSKLQFIEYLSSQILNSNIQIGLLTLASLISYRLIYKNIKKGFKELYKNIKMRKHTNKSKIKFFQSQSPDITDDKLCIICYNACRNTIIFNCRHVIMCNQCIEAYHQQICPICKDQIDSYQRFYQQ